MVALVDVRAILNQVDENEFQRTIDAMPSLKESKREVSSAELHGQNSRRKPSQRRGPKSSFPKGRSL